jgi:site-specific DNA-adenine methylase
VRLKPFFTYYGGKYRIAPKYPSPKYDKIIEPFCGSAGYSLTYSQKRIHLYDVNERIVGLWNYLIKVDEKEILNLPEIFNHISELTNIPQEAKWLIGFWCNKGSCEPRNMPSSWMRSGVRPNSYWGEAIKNRIASQLKHIRHWSCELKSYNQLVDNSPATWFIDPPYSSTAGRLYTYDSIDYTQLSEFCMNRNGQTIVCESEGASWLPFTPLCVAKGSESPRGGKKIIESIWYNDIKIIIEEDK